MLVKLFGLLLFWGIGLWMLRDVWIDFRRGYGQHSFMGVYIRRKDDPVGSWMVLILNAAFGIGFLIAGLLVLVFAKGA